MMLATVPRGNSAVSSGISVPPSSSFPSSFSPCLCPRFPVLGVTPDFLHGALHYLLEKTSGLI